MNDYSELIKKIESSDEEIYWLGSSDDAQILLLEELLKAKLSRSFKKFLRDYGGGGVVENEISGIENNDATLKTGGTVLGDTLECRKDFNLPNYLVVVFYQYKELAWCLDSSKMDKNNECPIVSYDLFSKKITNNIADNFELFFKEYLELRAGV